MPSKSHTRLVVCAIVETRGIWALGRISEHGLLL